jgi:hypothetical protein
LSYDWFSNTVAKVAYSISSRFLSAHINRMRAGVIIVEAEKLAFA